MFIVFYILPVTVDLPCQLDWIKGNLEDELTSGYVWEDVSTDISIDVSTACGSTG